MRVLRSPVTQFLAIGLLTVFGIIVGTSYLAGQSASDEAIAEARSTTEILARSIAEPSLRKGGLLKGDAGAIDKFDRAVGTQLQVEDPKVERVIIWSSDGTIVYSDDGTLLQRNIPLDKAQQRSLADRNATGSELVDPDRQADLVGETSSGLVQVYTRIETPDGEPLLFEAYYSTDQIEQRRQEIFGSFRWISVGPVILLMALVTLMLSFLTRQLTSSAKDRERLLQSAINASDAERRRIARDLHDGVVQDLAGTAFSISAVARSRDTPAESRTLLEGAGGSLRDSLTALRSLLAEIHPPDFHADGLAAAVDDLIAPASTAGIQASASVKGTADASDAMAALVWRVAQELVRNAIRHSRATTLAVTVRGDAGGVLLEVVDDGVGFDPAQLRDSERYGLRGLRSLVTDVGGVLEVHSAPGEGTTVRMRVKAT